MTTVRQRLTRSLDARTRTGIELGPYDVTIERGLRVPMGPHASSTDHLPVSDR